MDSVTKSIAASIKRYPTLYSCRTDVLDHMFCGYGTGYEWVKGKLIDPYKKKGEKYKHHTNTLPKKIHHLMTNDLKMRFELEEDWYKKYIEFKIQHASKLAFLTWIDKPDADFKAISNPMKEVSIDIGYRKPMRQLDEKYSPLCNVPNNVEESWLAAAREIAGVILHPNSTLPTLLGTLSFSAEQIKIMNEKNKELAHTILADLEHRFPIICK